MVGIEKVIYVPLKGEKVAASASKKIKPRAKKKKKLVRAAKKEHLTPKEKKILNKATKIAKKRGVSLFSWVRKSQFAHKHKNPENNDSVREKNALEVIEKTETGYPKNSVIIYSPEHRELTNIAPQKIAFQKTPSKKNTEIDPYEDFQQKYIEAAQKTVEKKEIEFMEENKKTDEIYQKTLSILRELKGKNTTVDEDASYSKPKNLERAPLPVIEPKKTTAKSSQKFSEPQINPVKPPESPKTNAANLLSDTKIKDPTSLANYNKVLSETQLRNPVLHTAFDKVLHIVNENGIVSAAVVQNVLKLDHVQLKECYNMLQKAGKIRVEYPLFGPAKLVSIAFEKAKKRSALIKKGITPQDEEEES